VRGALAGGTLALGDCSDVVPDSIWQAKQVQWRGNRGQCVGRPQAGTASPIPYGPCQPFALDGAQSFEFEFLTSGKLRVHPAGTKTSCVGASNEDPPENVMLGVCDGKRDQFENTALGQIAMRGYCLEAGGWDALRMRGCSNDSTQRWFLSGPLHENGGKVLTLDPVTGAFSAGYLVGTPTPQQIFDYYF
jgi:hypothetical protein